MTISKLSSVTKIAYIQSTTKREKEAFLRWKALTVKA